MAELPGELQRARHVDLEGRGAAPWVRRAILTVLAAICVLALVNVFGQDSQVSHGSGLAGTLRVDAPTSLRGGLFYQGRLDIVARHRIDHPTVVLAPGWTEQMQINTIEPSPAEESSRAGQLLLGFDALDPGQRLTIWLQYEANPLSGGRRDAGVVLRDGESPIVRIDRTLTVFP